MKKVSLIFILIFLAFMVAYPVYSGNTAQIVEHWDAVQPIPEKAMNTNTMF